MDVNWTGRWAETWIEVNFQLAQLSMCLEGGREGAVNSFSLRYPLQKSSERISSTSSLLTPFLIFMLKLSYREVQRRF